MDVPTNQSTRSLSNADATDKRSPLFLASTPALLVLIANIIAVTIARNFGFLAVIIIGMQLTLPLVILSVVIYFVARRIHKVDEPPFVPILKLTVLGIVSANLALILIIISQVYL